MAASTPARSAITIRAAKPEDAGECGPICYKAFTKINTDHGFPPDFPAPEMAVGVLTMMFSHPAFYCVVAEAEGRILGSNCLDERSIIGGIGPITVDPDVQDTGVGRQLMLALLERVQERKLPGVRLVQAAFHNRSFSLYSKLGFNAREPLAVMQGPRIGTQIDGCTVRPATSEDLAECNRVCMSVHGHDRGGELADGIQYGSAVVVERAGRITGYASVIAFFGHAVGESNQDVQALIAAAEAFGGPGILVPVRNAELFRWCLGSGLRVVELMNLMTMGLYNEPAGAYLPSISF